MVKKVRKQTTQTKAAGVTRRRSKPQVIDEEERLLRKATEYLICKHGMFLVATGLREARIKGFRVWIVTVTMRYTTGHEGYIGDLLYDGEAFTFLTPAEVRKERARTMAGDPERIRKWKEHRASTLPAGEG